MSTVPTLPLLARGPSLAPARRAGNVERRGFVTRLRCECALPSCRETFPPAPSRTGEPPSASSWSQHTSARSSPRRTSTTPPSSEPPTGSSSSSWTGVPPGSRRRASDDCDSRQTAKPWSKAWRVDRARSKNASHTPQRALWRGPGRCIPRCRRRLAGHGKAGYREGRRSTPVRAHARRRCSETGQTDASTPPTGSSATGRLSSRSRWTSRSTRRRPRTSPRRSRSGSCKATKKAAKKDTLKSVPKVCQIR